MSSSSLETFNINDWLRTDNNTRPEMFPLENGAEWPHPLELSNTSCDKSLLRFKETATSEQEGDYMQRHNEYDVNNGTC